MASISLLVPWSPHPARRRAGPELQTENPVLGLQGAGAAVRQVYTGVQVP